MPSYCSAANCKNNGINNPDVSFFKIPLHRPYISDKWITAMKRENWIPTKYSCLCSIHFTNNCFIKKNNSRLRLSNDAIPTIFDFRVIKTNRKKVEESVLLNLDEKDCPDGNLYELITKQTLIFGENGDKNCFICFKNSDSNISANTVIETKTGNHTIGQLVQIIGSVKVNSKENKLKFVCSKCVEQILNAFSLKTNLEKKNYENINNREIYCICCSFSFHESTLSQHMLNCKMKDEICNIDIKNRQLFVCCLCRVLCYKHNAEKHLENCEKIVKGSSGSYK